MFSNQKRADSAIENAYNQLLRGKKQAARSWAQRAIRLAPKREDPWLILAALAGPRAGLEYLKEALRINPDSLRARRGLLEVQKKLEGADGIHRSQAAAPDAIVTRSPLEKTGGEGLPVPRRPAVNPRFNQHDLRRLGLISLSGLAFVAIAALTMALSQNGIVKAHALTSSSRKLSDLQPISASSRTATPVPIQFITPTLTGTPIINSPTPPAAIIATGEKRIVVDISQQHLYAYQGDTLVYSFIASTGAGNSTSIGTFSILDKNPNAWSDPWGFWMPDWMGIYWSGYLENGIHALPVLTNGNVIWGADLGIPVSHGCVVLNAEDARLLFDWADIGTPVIIMR